MLLKHANRVRTYFAVDYEPQLGATLGEAAARLHSEFEPSGVAVKGPLGYTFKWPTQRCYLELGIARLMWHSLGLAEWSENRDRYVKIMETALEAFGVADLKRVGFKVSAYLPLDMSHQEMCDLMFGSFLVSANCLNEVLGSIADPLVQFQGEREGMEYILQINPMNPEQAAKAFRASEQLEDFLEDKYLDTGVRDFQERITAAGSLFVDVDLFRKNVATDTVSSFVKETMVESERIVNACVRRLRSQPPTARNKQ
jgi:hypothetical protein